MQSQAAAVDLFGVHLLGVNAETGRKLLLTLVFVVAIWLVGTLLRRGLALLGDHLSGARFRFWGQQASAIGLTLLLVVGSLSIWFDNPARLGAALSLLTAGIAFALQRVITAVAGYFIILRGKTFNVGDRIVMGGVRGDVVALTFMQTKIMEMGEPPPVQDAKPAVWVHSRQFTGRICTVSNDKIFDEPVYNYSHHFPYIWDEIRLPVRYADDHARAEEILLKAAQDHALRPDQVPAERLETLDRLYGLKHLDFIPQVYMRLTDNWIELAVRFLTPDHGTRSVKDAMSRQILEGLEQAGIAVASATYEITNKAEVTLKPPG